MSTLEGMSGGLRVTLKSGLDGQRSGHILGRTQILLLRGGCAEGHSAAQKEKSLHNTHKKRFCFNPSEGRSFLAAGGS